MDTIYALSTAPGKAGVAIIRVSGDQAAQAVSRLAGDITLDRTGKLRPLKDASGMLLDNALVLGFEGPASFTGEDVVELHVHGSQAVIDAVSRELGRTALCRPAEPGEFTRRALQNKKVDLTQVEGLADLIDAQTEVQRQLAIKAADGDFLRFVESLRADLIRAASLLEAVIDFADEEVPEDVSAEVLALLERTSSVLADQLDGYAVSERIRDGFRVAIIGPPNAGKSTLLNNLAGREAAITSEHAGTTRDTIEVNMDLAGLPVTFIDTAGVRKSDDPVEQIGISRALRAAKDADIRVFLGGDVALEVMKDDLVLVSKDDDGKLGTKGVSGKTGAGVAALVKHVVAVLSARVASAGHLSRERHAVLFQQAVVNVEQARKTVSLGSEHYELAAEDLRSVVRGLDGVIGRVDVEGLLDVIFSSFCLGK